MKRTLILTASLLWAAGCLLAQEYAPIDNILRQIESNNKELQADVRQTAAQKQENRSENNLPDPTLSYAHLWDSKDSHITAGELVISQSFDFPTLYASRNRLNRLRNSALDARSQTLRQDILLQAKELCLDIITLYRRQLLLDERLKNAEELSALYEKRLETGDANRMEINKVNLELLNVRTETRMNRMTLQTALQNLLLLNSNVPLTPGRPSPDDLPPSPAALGLTEYPAVPMPTDFVALCDELLPIDPTLQSLEQESRAARSQISVGRQGWLPQLEVGYRRNTESGHPLNGVVVGFSFPIFENRGKVKTAKALSAMTDFRKENAELAARSTLRQLYDEAATLNSSIREYEETLTDQQNLDLLKQALTGGQISLIEYFVEVSTVYQSQSNLLELENQYQKTMAKLYRNKL